MRPLRPLHRGLAAALAVVALTATAIGAPGSTLAQEGDGAGDGAGDAGSAAAVTALDDASRSAVDLALDRIAPDLRAVPVQSAELARVESELIGLETTIRTARSTIERAEADLARLGGEREVAREEIERERVRRRVAGRDRGAAERHLAELAIAAYVGGGVSGDPLPADGEATTAAGRRRVLVGAVDDDLRDREATASAEMTAATRSVLTARDRLDAVVEGIDAATASRDGALAELARAEPLVPAAQDAFVDARLRATVVGADFTLVALDAYRSAARTIAGEQPSCGIGWSTLAGIGRVESRHGTYGGSSVGVDGRTSRRIIGIALDGSEGIAEIRDTDGGALDGDAVFDRAVGPMQFIPSTWRTVARDGDLDGVADPHNLYDAALTAAAYLCRSGSGLGGGSALERAILSYNQSGAYVRAVLGHRRDYDRLALPG
ncbi:MAG TPA: lytic murein transglycosylase [Acidimicrobiales bacterium]|nr:lytic murein transglycosylase [Acidimicrobiales bacterium]